MINILKVLFSAELFYILFLFSGAFKESFAIPVDLAAVFLILTVVIVFNDFVRNPMIKKHWVAPIVFLFSLLLLMLLNVLITGINDPAISKVVKFLTLTMPTFLLPFLFIKNKDSIKRLLQSIAILSVLLSLFSLPMILSQSGLFVGFNNGNYQGLARVTGVGFIVLVYFYYVVKKKYKLLTLLSLVVVAFSLISTGSRIPLIAIIIIGIYAVINSFIIKKNDVLIRKKSLKGFSLLAVLLLVLPFLYSKGYFQTIVYRFQVLFESDGGASTVGRVNRVESALKMFEENIIIGGGIGNFGEYYIGTQGLYAHNIFLEFLSELGLLGFAWLIAFLAFVLYRSFIFYRKPNYVIGTQIIIASCFLFFLINALVSGDMNANRPTFAFAAVLLILPHLENLEKQSQNNHINSQQ